jgi:acetylornithine/N-succinyldiaminopimelate aminotransferase
MLAAGAGDNVLRLLPPLNIGKAEVDAAIDKLDAAFSAIEADAANAARQSA